MRWPWSRSEQRQSGDYNDRIIAALDAAVETELASPRQTAIVEAAVGRWERPFRAATIDGRFGAALAPWLATVARDLATTGNSVLLLNDGQLTPGIYNDVTGPPDPANWIYHVDEVGPSSNRTRHVPSDALLHFKINETTAVPWRGQSPLAIARQTASAVAQVEQRVHQAARQPATSLVTFKDRATDSQQRTIRDALRNAGQNGRLAVLGGDAATDRIEPPFGAAMASIRRAVEASVLLAYGLSPALLSETANGAALRELERQFITGTLLPLARVIESEVQLKTGIVVKIDLSGQKFVDSFSQARAFKSLVDAGMTAQSAAAHLGIPGEFTNV